MFVILDLIKTQHNHLFYNIETIILARHLFGRLHKSPNQRFTIYQLYPKIISKVPAVILDNSELLSLTSYEYSNEVVN